MNRPFGPAVAALVMLATTGAYAACGTGKLVFSDKFDTLNSKEWGTADKWMSVNSGKLTIAETDGGFYTAYDGRKYRDVDYCVLATLTEGTDLASSYGGLMFWTRNSDDFYAFHITLDGYANVYRYDGDWTAIIDDRVFNGVKQGVGAVNELRVVTHGSSATFYINGQKFDTITDKHAPGTSSIGLVVQSPSKGKATYNFDNLEIREPTG
jgi:hypothetical protein